RSNRAVSTLSQLDLMIFDVMISELTLRKSAYMASMDIALTLLVNKFVLTISSIMAFSTNICLDLITFEPITSDVMTLDFKMAVCTRPKFASMASRERDVMWFDTMLDATISSARPVPNSILSDVITFAPIMSDVMTFAFRMFARNSEILALTALMLMDSICPLTLRLPVRFISSTIAS